jgi:hypothetical protein
MTMNETVNPEQVGRRAAEMLGLIEASNEYERLVESTKMYPDCWSTFSGYPIIAHWDLATDAEPLFLEAMRVLCLKAAVYEQTGGDETAAELVAAAPVDEMVHVVLAQYTLCVAMTKRLGIDFVHMTDRERFGYRPGNLTHQCYLAAGWGDDIVDQIEVSRHWWVIDSELRTFSSSHRYVWPSELDLMARLAGMRLRHRWGGWQREPFDRGSRTHISVWEKAT